MVAERGCAGLDELARKRGEEVGEIKEEIDKLEEELAREDREASHYPPVAIMP